MAINLFAGLAAGGAEIATTSKAIELPAGLHSYQLVATTSNAGSCICDIEVTNDGTNWIVLGTITLSPNNSTVTDGFTSFSGWRLTRAKITTFTGNNPLAKLWVQ